MKGLNRIFLVLMIFFASSCQGILFDPDARFLRQDNETKEIYLLKEDGQRIYSESAYFFDHACMSREKWLELYDLLQDSGAKDQADFIFKKILEN